MPDTPFAPNDDTASMTIEPRAFRDAMGRFATGVTVVTTLGSGRLPVGLTVNSFASVSLDPPLVLFCIDRDAQSLDAMKQTAMFAINVLAEDQADLSRRFARREANRWSGISVDDGLDGVPLLPGRVAGIECNLETTYDGGDHDIVIGRVRRLSIDADRRPLLFFGGRYAALGTAL